jgi:hypothetical protein
MAQQGQQAVQKDETHIDAPPGAVYSVVSDVTRTGEWSPECRRCEWVEGATGPSVGARFRGYNRYSWLRWSRLNEVITAEPAREFAFKVLTDWFNKDSSIWRYRMEPKDGGTLLSESTEVLKWPGLVVRVLSSLARRPDDMTNNIEQSLQRIKTIVESRK